MQWVNGVPVQEMLTFVNKPLDRLTLQEVSGIMAFNLATKAASKGVHVFVCVCVGGVHAQSGKLLHLPENVNNQVMNNASVRLLCAITKQDQSQSKHAEQISLKMFSRKNKVILVLQICMALAGYSLSLFLEGGHFKHWYL